MKKLLVITYYWPPMGGGGVQRWLKFVKYLRRYGWEPVVFTTEGGNISIRDESLFEDVPDDLQVIRHPILEPYGIYNRLMGKGKDEGFHAGFVEMKEEQGRPLMKKFTMWVRGALFIPDAKMFWIRPAAKRIHRALSKEGLEVDAILSTGPPHSTHLIAERVLREHDIPWVADFRDPWTEIDFFHHLPMPKWAERRHRKLERKVLQNADRVLTVSWSWAQDLERIGGRKVGVVTNGFDEEDLPQTGPPPLSQAFTITHAGVFNKDRNPEFLWDAMGELAEEDPSFKEALSIRLIGPTDHSILEGIEANGLSGNIEQIPQLPHREVIPYLRTSWLLLLPLNNTPNIDGVIPGKLYEYLGARRPVLCTGKPDGDAGRILNETGSGKIVDFNDRKGMRKALEAYYRSYTKGNLRVDAQGIERYSRRELARSIAKELDALIP